VNRGVAIVATSFLLFAASCGGSGYSQEDLDAAVDEAVERALASSPTTSSTAPELETSTTSSTSTSTPPPTTTVAEIEIAGTVTVAWWVSPDGDRGRSECGDMVGSYQVEIRDGGNVVKAVARLHDPVLVSDGISQGTQEIECDFTYSAMTEPLPVYTFTVSNSQETLASVTANGSEVTAAGGPTFLVTFVCVSAPCTSRGQGGYPSPGSDAGNTATTTTVFETVASAALDISESSLVCEATGQAIVAEMTFKIRSTSDSTVDLYQVALFPYGVYGHTFLDPNWWPLPTLQAGETVTHTESFELLADWGEQQLELFVDSSGGQESTFIDCPH
jgi:hypothetical protein